MKGYCIVYRTTDNAVVAAAFGSLEATTGQKVASGITGVIPDLFGPAGEMLKKYDATKKQIVDLPAPVFPDNSEATLKEQKFILLAAKKEATAAGDNDTAAHIQKKIDALPK